MPPSLFLPYLHLSPTSNHQEEGPHNEDLASTSEEGGRHEQFSSFPSKPDTTQPAPAKKSSQPSKLVDLGAAAAFASQAAAEKQQKTSTIDTVFGDFSSQPTPQPPPTGAATNSGV